MTFRANEPGSREDALAEAETHRVRLETWEKERIELTAQRDEYEAKWKLAKHELMQAEFDRDAARAELAEVKAQLAKAPRVVQGGPVEPMPYRLESDDRHERPWSREVEEFYE